MAKPSTRPTSHTHVARSGSQHSSVVALHKRTSKNKQLINLTIQHITIKRKAEAETMLRLRDLQLNRIMTRLEAVAVISADVKMVSQDYIIASHPFVARLGGG